jgi:2-polyprenyl-3-methyl-5-hydroxy-6-metoxy-1,4-benzoquinol methylase
MVFADHLPSPAVYQRYYREVSKYDASATISPIDRQRRDWAAGFVLQFAEPDAAVLDVGCGAGHFLGALQSLGFQCLRGVDPAPLAPTLARNLYGLLQVECATLSEVHRVVDLQSVDVLCMWAVVEHRPDVRSDLAALVRHMRPGSRLMLEVPALESFDGASGEVWGELSLEHIQFFTRQSLANLMAQSGARLLAAQTQGWELVRSGSLFAAFEVTRDPPVAPQPCMVGAALMAQYVQEGRDRMPQLLALIPQGPWILYGAGAHSLRLLAHLDEARLKSLQAILDANANLHGQCILGLPVQPPDALACHPGVPVVISSFRAQEAIGRQLAQRFPNPRIRLYP